MLFLSNVVFGDEWFKNGTKEYKITVYINYLSQWFHLAKEVFTNKQELLLFRDFMYY